MTEGSWLADNDYGECFLNFPLHPYLQKYCGVDLTQLFPNINDADACMVVGVWLHCAMGLHSSPYNIIQGALVAKRFVLGDPDDIDNAFQWSFVIENLPCSQLYDASEPLLQKWCEDGLTASEIAQYVDDLRLVAATKDLAWQAGSQVAKRLCWLGLQDTARKRRMGSQHPGAWTGSVVTFDGDSVRNSVTKDHWTKVQRKVRWLAQHVGLWAPHSLLEADVPAPGDEKPSSNSIQFKTTERFVGSWSM